MKQLIFVILTSATIGWITNYIAIKMLFRPHKEINFGFFKIQGLIPKRKAEIGNGIANVIQNELISIKDVVNNIDKKEFSKKLESLVDEILEKNLKSKIKEIVPGMMAMFITDNIVASIADGIKSMVMENQENIFNIFTSYAEDNIDFAKIIAEKISNFSLDKLEEIIIYLAKKELKHIEIIGAVLGGIIGVLEYFIFKFI